MDDTASVATSTLAVSSEKRPKRTGGCVGIFFQLFDWNRRFAKKKLFSNRLLPPDRAKEASKKFGGDDNLPKLRLIADENSGGFPNMNKNGGAIVTSNVGKNGVQTPSLVARLMGLETMPPGKRGKVLKDSSGDFRDGRRENDEYEKETTRQEFRPQKLQKTETVERRTVTRFGSEALQLKNVLSRSRKHHHPKLVTPVKSNSHHTRKNSSRLIGAATRLLEPGLQGRGRSRKAITYPRSERRPLGDEFRSESLKGENVDLSGSFNRCKDATVSCNKCGNMLDIAESTSKRDVHTSVFDSVHPSQVSPNGNSRYAHTSFNQEQEFSTIPIDRGRHVQRHVTNQHSQPQNLATTAYFIDNNHRMVDVGVSSQSTLKCMPFNRVAFVTDAVSDTEDFVALNKGLSGRTRSRVPAKVEDTKFDKRSNFESGRDNCFSPGQKRQFTHIRKQGESAGMVCSSTNRPRMVSNTASTRKNMGSHSRSVVRIGIERRPDYPGQGGRVVGGGGNKNSDGMAFRFNSPMKNRYEVPTKVERRRNSSISPSKTTTRKKFTSNQIDEKICLQKPSQLTGDSLGPLQEEKLHVYESRINATQPNRTSANIFQELICALNKERSISQNDMTSQLYCNPMYDHDKRFCVQTKPETAGAQVGRKYSDHFSPGSVLEASFSNDSCCSSSLEDSSVRTHNADSMSYLYKETLFPDSEINPFYSGVLLRKENTHYELVADLLTFISQVLCSNDLLSSRIKGHIRAHIKEVIFNSELVLGNQSPHSPNDVFSFFILPLFLKLDTLVEIMWTRFGNFIGSEHSNIGYQLNRFVFDALVEYLDSEYSKYPKCGFKTWSNLPPFIRPVTLIHEIVMEVKKWMGFIGVTSDELVDRDMSHCLGKWTDYEIEEYETGAKVAGDILQMLVNEIVMDLSTGITYFRC